MRMIGRAFDWCVMAAMNAEKTLREAFEVRVRKAREDEGPLDGDVSVRWFGETPALRVTWSLGEWHFRIGLGLDESEAEAVFKVAVPGVALWFAVEDDRLGELLRGTRERRYELRAHSGSLWWTVGGDGDWSSSDPWWREGSWSYVDALLGARKSRTVTLVEVRTTAPLPEGSYPVSVALQRVVTYRERFPVLSAEEHRVGEVNLVLVDSDAPRPMVPGKGENSWDLDPDTLYRMTLPAETVAEAVGGYVTAVMKTREQRAGRIDWKPPAADPSPAPQAPPTPRSASQAPFSPGSLAGGSAPADRAVDRARYLGSTN